MSRLLKLDSMSLAQLPEEMVTFTFALPGDKTASINLGEILSLGDSYENPHSITLALDQISAFKALWSSILAQREEKIDRQKERVAVMEAQIKMALPAILAGLSMKQTVDAIKDAFQATAVKHSLVPEKGIEVSKGLIETQFAVHLGVLCEKYRKKVVKLRALKEEASTLRVLVDALSNRSFALSKMADLCDVMLKQGLIQGDEGTFS